MKILSRDDLTELIQVNADHFVSLFMPTHRAGREQKQDPVRLKNLLRQAADQLIASSLPTRDAEQILEPAHTIRTDELFWRAASDGLAIFCTDTDFFRCYRLPLRFEEKLVVNAQRFYLKPLLPLLHSNGRFYVLALSQVQARLYESTRYFIHELTLPDIRRATVDGNDETLQYHSHRAPTSGKGNIAEAIYHGHGGPNDRTKDDIAKYFQEVNRAVRKVLGDDRAPLVLACVGYLAPIYATANSYAHLIRGKVPGSPDIWAPDELRDRAWQFVEPVFREKQQNAIDRLQKARGSELASVDLQEIVAAAGEGRVDTLFVSADEHQLRATTENNETRRSQVGERKMESEELLDYAAAQTLANSGEVFVMPVQSLSSDGQPVAALLRYPAPATASNEAAKRERSTAHQHTADGAAR